jgi:hypothetical protein
MSWYYSDIQSKWGGALTHEKMLLVTKTSKPYRGSNDTAFPMGWRDYSDRHFRIQPDGSFRIYYGNRLGIDEVVAKNERDLSLATVYPDNTVEINQTLHQGTVNYMSGALGYWFQFCGARGGTIAWTNAAKHMHPIFKGSRLHLDPAKKHTGEMATPYRVFQKRVNRKLANEAFKKYEEFVKVAPIMTKAMTKQGILETMNDLVSEGLYNKQIFTEGIPNVEKLVVAKRYVDALCLFMLCNNINHIAYTAFREIPALTGYWGSSDPDDRQVQLFNMAFEANVKNLLRATAIRSANAFDMKELEMGTALPKSRWGYIVMVDGKPVEQL